MRSEPLLLTLWLGPFLASGFDSSAQSASLASREGWEGTTTRDDSTLLVRTTRGSVWERSGALVEEVAIGTELRGEQDLLGQVYGIQAAGNRIFILDREGRDGTRLDRPRLSCVSGQDRSIRGQTQH